MSFNIVKPSFSFVGTFFRFAFITCVFKGFGIFSGYPGKHARYTKTKVVVVVAVVIVLCLVFVGD